MKHQRIWMGKKQKNNNKKYIDTTSLASNIANELVKIEELKKEKNVKTEQEKKSAWRKRIGYKDYSAIKNKTKRAFLEDINAITCFAKMLSGKEEYIYPGLMENFLVRLITISILSTISMLFIFASFVSFLIAFTNIFPEIIAFVLYALNVVAYLFGQSILVSSKEIVVAIQQIIGDFNFVLSLSFATFSFILFIFGLSIRVVAKEYIIKKYEGKEEISTLLSLFFIK